MTQVKVVALTNVVGQLIVFMFVAENWTKDPCIKLDPKTVTEVPPMTGPVLGVTKVTVGLWPLE